MDGRLIGADLGGTKLSVARMHEGTLEEHSIVVTDKSSADALLDWLQIAPDRRIRRESVLDANDLAGLHGGGVWHADRAVVRCRRIDAGRACRAGDFRAGSRSSSPGA